MIDFAEAPACGAAQTLENALSYIGAASRHFCKVEPRGLEPLTSAVRKRIAIFWSVLLRPRHRLVYADSAVSGQQLSAIVAAVSSPPSMLRAATTFFR